MSKLLENQTIVVTGGARGCGRGIALKAAENGADVVVADLQKEQPEGTPTHEQIEEETNSEAAFVECDVTKLEDIKSTASGSPALAANFVIVSARSSSVIPVSVSR